MLVKIKFDNGECQYCSPSDMVRVINKGIKEEKTLKNISFFKEIEDFEAEEY